MAQVPETGRWQNLIFTADAVHESTATRYHEIVSDLAAKDTLDDSPLMSERVRQVAARLIRVAVVLKPEAATWEWEIHTTSDPDWDASCMAGGKLLVGTKFVAQLALGDGELATLLGHEIAHALAEHHREELSEVVLRDPTHPNIGIETAMARLETDLSLQIRLAVLSRIQESEADQIGMILTQRAGWPVADMVSFYRKLVAADPPTFRDWSHPSAASRLNMAQILAVLFSQ
jgi:predicted Zn-dependent protease